MGRITVNISNKTSRNKVTQVILLRLIIRTSGQVIYCFLTGSLDATGVIKANLARHIHVGAAFD